MITQRSFRQSHSRLVGFALAIALTIISFSTQAQHTMTIEEGDTVYLSVDNWRGDLQWQGSTNLNDWTDLEERTSDTIKYVPKQFPFHLRLKITEETCEPHYSETVTINRLIPQYAQVSTRQALKVGARWAVLGGTISDTGGVPILERGIIYSTTPNVDLENDPRIVAKDNSNEFSVALMGLTPNTMYFVRAYAVNKVGTSYGGEIAVTTTISDQAYAIGSTGPAGGIVFYDKGTFSDGWRYLEAAPAGWNGTSDPWFNVAWGCSGTLVGGTSTDVGTGLENTETILLNGCADPTSAVAIAANSTIGGFSDWFLPSRDELNHLYNKLFPLGPNFHDTYGFMIRTYASSSELDANSAWGYDFAAGGNIQHVKTSNASITVRPVRRF